MEETKTPGEKRRKELFYAPKNGWDRLTPETEAALRSYCEDYKKFLDESKTEREAVDTAIALAEAKGFRPFTRGMALQPGDKVYRSNRGKALMLAVIGSEPLDQGARIGAAHIDSPRLDLKPNPLYEDSELAFLKTHYYGGMRKYQWVTIPLELHGVVALKDGSVVKVAVGSGRRATPCLPSTTCCPTWGRSSPKSPWARPSPARASTCWWAAAPSRTTRADRVKLAVLDLLNQKYGIMEEDFISAELAAVPAFRASDIGFDRSLIGAYGHDDRVCAYASLAALLDLGTPQRTAVCMLADKEEIGSEGVSGMKSAAFDTFMSDLCDTQRVPLKACYEKSFCLSADVTRRLRPQLSRGL